MSLRDRSALDRSRGALRRLDIAEQRELARQELDPALDLWRRSLEVDPGQCYVAWWAVGRLLRIDRGEEAVAIARRAVASRPGRMNQAPLALALARTGRYDEAPGHAREALSGAVAEPVAAIQTAICALATAGLPGEALDAARRLAQHGGTDASRATGQQLVSAMLGLLGRPRDAVASWPGGDPRLETQLVDAPASILALGRAGSGSPEAARRLRSAPHVEPAAA